MVAEETIREQELADSEEHRLSPANTFRGRGLPLVTTAKTPPQSCSESRTPSIISSYTVSTSASSYEYRAAGDDDLSPKLL